tara:strand:+ start:339 stop:854 length:516 start_codon:yes stop_codon:yes gene_type:complete
MGSNINEVYYCQFERTDELSRRTYNRNLASKQMVPKYFSRPVSNRRTLMPVVDTVKKSSVKKGVFADFNMKKDFIPGTNGPYTGYSNNIDVETQLFNRFFPLQKCPQNKFIPDSKSSLYNMHVPKTEPVNIPFNELNKPFEPIEFNPNSCNLSSDLFFNHTRQQIKNVNLQ